jgi:hypothetical protein
MKEARAIPENVGVSIFSGIFFQKTLAGKPHLWYNIYNGDEAEKHHKHSIHEP